MTDSLFTATPEHTASKIANSNQEGYAEYGLLSGETSSTYLEQNRDYGPSHAWGRRFNPYIAHHVRDEETPRH